MKKVILLSFLLALNLYSTPYKTIETNEARIVFQEGLEKQAQETAEYITTLKPYYENGNTGLLKKIPIILEKENSTGNGYFTNGPDRIRLYPTAYSGQELGKDSWIKSLSIHEYRHYAQSQMAQDNWISKTVSFLMGPKASGILARIAGPIWVAEGDAVYYETKLTDSGRGRTPYFLKWYRALMEDGKHFSYNQAKNFSLKELRPNSYNLGYMLVTYGTEKYGDKFWDEVIKKGGYVNSFTPLSNTLKELTGLTSEEFYESALAYFGEKYKVEKTVNYDEIIKKDKSGLSIYPYEYNGGILYLNLDLDKNTEFYLYKDGEDKRILDLGLKYDEHYQLRGDNIIWTDPTADKTNKKKIYSNIETYNIKTKERKTLTKKGSYFYPSYSHKQDKIAVANNNGMDETTIQILDSDGKTIEILPNAKNYFYNYIDWTEDDNNLIVCVKNKKEEMSLVQIDLDNLQEKELIPFGQYILKSPKVHEDNIYFSAAFDLVENVYRYNLNDKKIYKLTESNIGTDGGSIINGELYFSEFSSMGYHIKKSKDIIGKEFTPTSLLDDKVMNLDSFKNTDLKIDTIENTPVYDIKNYNYFKHLVNFNTWSYGLDDKSAYISLVSDNELEDFNLNINYSKDKVNNSESLDIKGLSTKYWPNTKFSYEKKWGSLDKNEIDLGLSFPVNLSKGNIERTLNLDLDYIDYFDEKNQMEIKGSIYNGEKKSFRDLVSENSQSVKVGYRASLNNSNENELKLDYKLTTRGFFENDGFLYGFDYDKSKLTVQKSKESIIPRGYNPIEYTDGAKLNLDYLFPIGYPEVGKMGLFINRVSGGLYYDKAFYDGDRIKSTLGTKANFDITILALLPTSLELQYNYLLEEKESVLNLTFKMNN